MKFISLDLYIGFLMAFLVAAGFSLRFFKDTQAKACDYHKKLSYKKSIAR